VSCLLALGFGKNVRGGVLSGNHEACSITASSCGLGSRVKYCEEKGVMSGKYATGCAEDRAQALVVECGAQGVEDACCGSGSAGRSTR